MKVSKPPSGSLAGAPVGLPEAKRAGAKGFADKLAKAAGSGKARAADAVRTAALTRSAKTSRVADIGKALRAGQITPQAAIDRVVERIVARQAGLNAPAAVKQHLSAVLRQSLEDDPMLAAKIRALGEDKSG